MDQCQAAGPQCQPQVMVSVELLFKMSEELGMEVNALEERLERVIRSSVPKTKEDSSQLKAAEEIVPLASSLSELWSRLNSTKVHLQDLRARLEV